MSQRAQCCYDASAPILNYMFKTTLVKIPACFFVEVNSQF